VKEREREIYSANFILVHSSLSYIQFPKQPLGSTSNHSHITNYTPTKRRSWNHKNHSPSLQTHTLTSFHTPTSFWKNKYKNHERNWLHLSLQESESSYDQTLNQCTAIKKSCKLLKNFFQNQFQSHCIWYQTSVFCFKGKAIFIAHKTSRSRQHLWAKTILIHFQNRLTGFQKAIMKCHNQPVEKSF